MSPTFSTSSTTQRLLQRSSRMNPATETLNRRTRAMRNSTMSLAEKRCLHHCLLRSEKNQRTWDKLISLSWIKFVASSALFHTLNYWETRVRTKFRFVSKTKIKSRNGERKNQDSPWKIKKEQILAEVRTEIHQHDVQADSDWRSIQELNGIIDSQRREIIIPLQVMGNSDEINYFCMNNLHNKIGIFVKVISKVSWDGRIEASSRVTSRWIFEKKDVENQDTINELTVRIL